MVFSNSLENFQSIEYPIVFSSTFSANFKSRNCFFFQYMNNLRKMSKYTKSCLKGFFTNKFCQTSSNAIKKNEKKRNIRIPLPSPSVIGSSKIELLIYIIWFFRYYLIVSPQTKIRKTFDGCHRWFSNRFQIRCCSYFSFYFFLKKRLQSLPTGDPENGMPNFVDVLNARLNLL